MCRSGINLYFMLENLLATIPINVQQPTVLGSMECSASLDAKFVDMCIFVLPAIRLSPALTEFYIELEYTGSDADWTDSRKATFEAAARR